MAFQSSCVAEPRWHRLHTSPGAIVEVLLDAFPFSYESPLQYCLMFLTHPLPWKRRPMNDHGPQHLTIFAFSGVQTYITESRTTADLRAASQIITHLVTEAVRHLIGTHGAEMVFPPPDAKDDIDAKDGMPNRVVALLPSGQGATAAKDTKKHVEATWKRWVKEVFYQEMPPVPDWPKIQWVSVPVAPGSYKQAWDMAQRTLAERKNICDFTQPEDSPAELCMLSPRWRAVDQRSLPQYVPEHWKSEQLAVANWVKRMWGRTSYDDKTQNLVVKDSGRSFPSTNAIASLPYRYSVLRLWGTVSGISELVGQLHKAATEEPLASDPIKETLTPGLPDKPIGEVANWLRRRGSRWIYPETWHVDALARECTETLAEADVLKTDPSFIQTVRSGERAAQELVELMVAQGEDPPSPHLAVLVHDLDSMGEYLSGDSPGQDGRRLDLSLGHGEHSEVSARMARTATRQRKAVQSTGGVVVYAGGDDLLALVPAKVALDAARACRAAGDPGLPHASNGLLFFHHGSSLQHALNRANELLNVAKELDGRNGLGVGYIRASGSHADCALPWAEKVPKGAAPKEGSPVDALELFVPHKSHPRARLSPRLLADLLAQRNHLDEDTGQSTRGTYQVLPFPKARAVMKNLVLRHTSLTPSRSTEHDEKTDEHPGERDERERKAFAEAATESLLRMAPGQRRVDENAIRVALFLRQETR